MSGTDPAPPAPRPVALVTGGTDGIGQEVARLLTSLGWHVVATGRNPPAAAPGGGGASFPGIVHLAADQSDPARAAQAIAATCERAGGIEAAILCAGTGTLATDGCEGADAIRRTLRVNLEGTVLIAHALAPGLLERGGALVLVGSTARRGAGGLPSYAASKAGLHGFARALGEEWRGRAGVLMLHPGPTRTAMQAKAGLDVSRIAWAFVPPALMARMIVARLLRERGRRRPHLASLGHAAAARAWLVGRLGLDPVTRHAAPSGGAEGSGKRGSTGGSTGGGTANRASEREATALPEGEAQPLAEGRMGTSSGGRGRTP